jgi:hypothetical protein
MEGGIFSNRFGKKDTVNRELNLVHTARHVLGEEGSGESARAGKRTRVETMRGRKESEQVAIKKSIAT